MKHSLLAAARAAPLHGLLATAMLHALAAQKLDAKTAPTLAPAATDLDTGQPQAIAFATKAKVDAGKKPLRRDAAGPPIGHSPSKRRHSDGYHRQRSVALN
jgi:hypothetical protein